MNVNITFLGGSGTVIRIHGQNVVVRAEVVKLSSASAHADGNQLIAWLRSMGHAPDQVYVVHGEMDVSVRRTHVDRRRRSCLTLRCRRAASDAAAVPQCGWPCAWAAA